jgi:hypothetical protein
MIIFISFLTFILGTYIGLKVSHYLLKKDEEQERKKIIDNINKIYNEVLTSVSIGKIKYKTRVNQICYLVSEIETEGVIEIVYMIDKKDLGIFKNGKCIYTSDLANKETIRRISDFIEFKFRKEISDVVNILGMVVSKSEFEKTLGIKFEDFEKIKNNMSQNFNPDEFLKFGKFEDTLSEIEDNFDIDDILDKISAFGLNSLTSAERLFLDNYSNDKNN